jgi:hypothetical protein
MALFRMAPLRVELLFAPPSGVALCHSEVPLSERASSPGSPTPGFPDCAAFAQSGMAMSAVVAVVGAERASRDEESAPLNPSTRKSGVRWGPLRCRYA